MSSKKKPAKPSTAQPASPATPSPADSLVAIQAKFARLNEIRAKLVEVKQTLYAEYDSLMRELLPLFVQQDQDAFLILREITVGTKKYRFSPVFWSDKDGLKSKTWKSTPFEFGLIEMVL